MVEFFPVGMGLGSIFFPFAIDMPPDIIGSSGSGTCIFFEVFWRPVFQVENFTWRRRFKGGTMLQLKAIDQLTVDTSFLNLKILPCSCQFFHYFQHQAQKSSIFFYFSSFLIKNFKHQKLKTLHSNKKKFLIVNFLKLFST